MKLLIIILFISVFSVSYGQREFKRSFYFETGSAKLDSIQLKKLKVIQRKYKIDYAELEIYGFTDEQGGRVANVSLAKRRVETLRSIIDPNGRMRGVNEFYFGEDSLAFTADSLNRRVDIVIRDYTAFFNNKSMRMKHVLFVPGEDIYLDERAIASVNNLTEILKENPDFKIQIEGHVCCGPDTDLSLRRAKRVLGTLVDNGIDPERLSVKGFSNKNPITRERTEKEAQLNRRVEVRVLS